MDVNNNNNIAASRSADHLALRIAVITSTRLRFVTPSTHQSSATLLMFAGVVISAHLSEGQSRSPVTFLSLSLTGRRHTTQRAPPRRRRRRLVAVRSPTSGALVHRPSSQSASSTHGPSETSRSPSATLSSTTSLISWPWSSRGTMLPHHHASLPLHRQVTPTSSEQDRASESTQRPTIKVSAFSLDHTTASVQ